MMIQKRNIERNGNSPGKVRRFRPNVQKLSLPAGSALLLASLLLLVFPSDSQAQLLSPATPGPGLFETRDELYKKKGGKGTRSVRSSRSTSAPSGGLTRLNMGVGWNMTHVPGPIGQDSWQYGLALDFFLVKPPGVVAAEDAKLKSDFSFLRFYQKDENFWYKPFYLMLLPTQVFINPFKDNQIWGGSMSFAEMWLAFSPNKDVSFRLGASVPTITIFHASGDALRDSDWFLGLGASLKFKALGQFSESSGLAFGYTQSFYLPGDDTKFRYEDGTDGKIWTLGSMSFQYYYRLPFSN